MKVFYISIREKLTRSMSAYRFSRPYLTTRCDIPQVHFYTFPKTNGTIDLHLISGHNAIWVILIHRKLIRWYYWNFLWFLLNFKTHYSHWWYFYFTVQKFTINRVNKMVFFLCFMWSPEQIVLVYSLDLGSLLGPSCARMIIVKL